MDRSQKGNSHINQIVEDYLTQTKTDYAVLITGGWGTGKTHYFKNVLMKKVIPKVNVPEQDERKYRSILVSLFGLRSREEVLRKILYKLEEESKNQFGSFFTWVSDSARKIIQDPQVGLPGFQVTLNIPDPTEFFLMNTKDEELKRIVLILDDLERSQLPIVERLGIIDNFLNMGCKVLLIANEEKFSELIEETEDVPKEKLRYKQMKEKVIGRTISFITEEKEIFKSLVDDGIKSSQKNDIKECAEKVIQICSEHREMLLLNFRILKEVIYIYQKIDGCVPQENKSVLKKQDLFIRILINSLMLKAPVNQKFSYGKNLEQRLQDLTVKKMLSTDPKSKKLSKFEEEELEYIRKVDRLKRCFDLSSYDAINEYVQDGYLDEAKISIELTKFYSDDLSSIELLQSWAFNTKSELEIKLALEDFWKKVEARGITLYIIKKLVYSLLSLAKEGIAGENLDKMAQKIMDKMNLYEWNNNEYQDFFIFFVEDYKEITEKIDDIKKAFEKEQLKRNASIANGFIEDYFVQKLIEVDASFKNANLEFIQMNDDLIKKIVDSTSTGNSDDYRRIHFFLQSRYPRNERLGKYSEDKDFLEKLRKSLEDKSQSPVKDNLAAYFCQICIKNLESICKQMNSDQS